jgi:hypothetical protein
MKQKPAAPDIREVVRQLAHTLGPTMVDAMAGDRVRLSANDWVLEDGPVPDEEEEARLRCAYKQWNVLAEAAHGSSTPTPNSPMTRPSPLFAKAASRRCT